MKPIKKMKPWISQKTLDLIKQRSEFRSRADYQGEKDCNKIIKQQVKIDRSNWLDDWLRQGDWHSIKRFKKGIKKRGVQQNLIDQSNIEISPEKHAEAMADHLENVQWHRRDGCEINQKQMLFAERLKTKEEDFTLLELCNVIKALKIIKPLA